MRQLESEIQQAFFRYVNLRYPELVQLVFAIPNGGIRSKVTAARLKREGVVAGVADVFISIPYKGKNHGTYIEFKSGKNRQTETQLTFERIVKRAGYQYYVCYDWQHARYILDEIVFSYQHDV